MPFIERIKESVQEFDQLLASFNFSDPQSSKTESFKQHVLASLQPIENSRSVNVSQATGNYCYNAMRKEDDQWIALLIGEKYLTEAEDTASAFQSYLKKFILDRVNYKLVSESLDSNTLKRRGYTIENNNPTEKESTSGKRTVKNQAHPVLQLLSNLIALTIRTASQISKEATNSASLYHVLVKLLHNCQKGIELLKRASTLEASHVLAKANLLIENIQEYFTPLQFLLPGSEHAVTDLKKIDQVRFSNALAIKPKQFEIFYNDGGLQAINAAILAMGIEGLTSFYLFPSCYFEIPDFCHDSGIIEEAEVKRTAKEKAAVWVCDITMIEAVKKEITQAKNLKGVIIDITNNSSTQQLEAIQTFVNDLRKQQLWVTLSCSTLKNEQFGQDKYQNGRNVIFPPNNKWQNSKTRGSRVYLEKISEAAINPVIASFRNMVEAAANEKYYSKISQQGIFRPKSAPKPTSEVTIVQKNDNQSLLKK